MTWSFSPTDEVDQEETNDMLYIVASDIIAAHNTFIKEVYSSVRAQHLPHFLPDEPPRVYPSEVSDSSCIVGKLKRWEYTFSKIYEKILDLPTFFSSKSHQ